MSDYWDDNGTPIFDAYEDDVAKHLVGHSIRSIDDGSNTVVLDDGTELEFRSEADCCAWYDVGLSKIVDLGDNIITGTSITDHKEPSEESWCEDGTEDYTIHVLSHDKRVFDIDVQGDPTSGYYCNSFNLVVRRKAVES